MLTTESIFQIAGRESVSKEIKQILLLALKATLEKLAAFQPHSASSKIQLISQLKNLQNLLNSSG
jgi:hypothetical protein